MFVDLSGFTQLTNTLMEKGAVGAEELSVTLNEIFQPSVQLVYQNNGFIPYFAGDSFTAIFPVSDDIEAVGQKFIATAQSALQHFEKEKKDGGSLFEYEIGIKIGMSFGRVDWGIVGDLRKSYYFRGTPIDSSGIAQSKAGNLQMIGDSALVQQFSPDILPVKSIGDGWYHIMPGKYFKSVKNTTPAVLPAPDPDILAQFCLRMSILATKQANSAM